MKRKKLEPIVGVEGEKGVFHVRLEKEPRFIPNDFNGTMLYVFRDKDDNNLSCFHGGKDLFTEEEEKKMIEDKTMFYLQGTVKSFSKYDDEPQTMLKLIKNLGLEPPMDKPKKVKKNTNSI